MAYGPTAIGTNVMRASLQTRALPMGSVTYLACVYRLVHAQIKTTLLQENRGLHLKLMLWKPLWASWVPVRLMGPLDVRLSPSRPRLSISGINQTTILWKSMTTQSHL